jgi:hypothetical protein
VYPAALNFDRYVSEREVPRCDVLNMAAASLLLATKFEESTMNNQDALNAVEALRLLLSSMDMGRIIFGEIRMASVLLESPGGLNVPTRALDCSERPRTRLTLPPFPADSLIAHLFPHTLFSAMADANTAPDVLVLYRMLAKARLLAEVSTFDYDITVAYGPYHIALACVAAAEYLSGYAVINVGSG